MKTFLIFFISAYMNTIEFCYNFETEWDMMNDRLWDGALKDYYNST